MEKPKQEKYTQVPQSRRMVLISWLIALQRNADKFIASVIKMNNAHTFPKERQVFVIFRGNFRTNQRKRFSNKTGYTNGFISDKVHFT